MALDAATKDLDAALNDSFNTPLAMQAIANLVNQFNSIQEVSQHTTLKISRWITRIITSFGLDHEGRLEDEQRVAWSGIEIPVEARPFVYPTSQLRDQNRQIVRSGNMDYSKIRQLVEQSRSATLKETTALGEGGNTYRSILEQFQKKIDSLASENKPAAEFLHECDELRNTHLWNLGIYLEDRESMPALVRQTDGSLHEARAAKEAAAATREEARRVKEANEAEKKRLLNEKSRINPEQMFRTQEFLDWDENGVPVKDRNGEISRSRRKKLIKEWEKQEGMYEQWLANSSFPGHVITTPTRTLRILATLD
jgi:cysteinyl-tRNA synthetase